jgi:PAS domain S-box-containing protein
MTSEKGPDKRAMPSGVQMKAAATAKLERQVAQLAAVNRFAQEITRHLTLKDVIASAYRQIQGIIHSDLVVIYLREGDWLVHQPPGKDFRQLAVNLPARKKVGQCLCGLVAENGTPIYSPDIHQDPQCTLKECKDMGVVSFAALPLFFGMRTVGVMGVASTKKRDFSDQDPFLRTMAAHVGISLHNAVLYEQVRQQTNALQEMLDHHEQMERALEQEASFRKAVIEGASEGICVCRVIDTPPFLEFSVWNRRMAEITGYGMEEVNRTGVTPSIVKTPEGAIPNGEILKQALRGENCRVDELEIIRPDGQRRVVSVSVTTLKPNGGKGHILAIIRDNTARKAAMDALLTARKFEAAGVMAAGIAHDFNNLLTVILGNVSLVQEELGEIPSVAPLLSQAEKSCLQARDLTLKLITFSNGNVSVRRTGGIQNTLRDTVKLALAGTSFKEDVRIAPDLWDIQFDEGQLKHALSNVLTNAVEASREGDLIEVRAENMEFASSTTVDGFTLSPGRYVAVSVRDHGRGILKEHLQRVFDPYFSTKEKGVRKGMGLGLAATYAIVTNHGGRVTIQSEMGVGTKVKMVFPVQHGGAEVQPALSPPPQPGNKKILVMEDERMLRELLGTMLSHLGYEAVITESSEEACVRYEAAMAEASPFDLVILDLTIRGGAGAETTIRRLKAIDGNVRAIVSSGHAKSPVIANFGEYGFIEKIIKPYTLTQLRNVVEGVLGASDGGG